MGKIGLCVRYDCDNYGSMLQILATQKAIVECGYTYEHIRYNKKTIGFLIKNLNRVFNPYFVRGKLMSFQKKMGLALNSELRQGNADRLQMFEKYREIYIKPYSPVYKGYSNLVKNAVNYSTIMVGSDQLWTPAGLQSKFYNLLFVPKSIKKIALATSFGVTEIPPKQIEQTRKYLNRIEYLSVRESSGARIVEELTGRKVIVAIDPTMLYTGEEWFEVFPFENKYEEKYIFAYFLGTDIEHRKIVELFAKEKGFKIITCPAMDEYVKIDLSFGDIREYKVGPIEFLNLIRGAEYVFTDSFHGTIFSILNHKRFLTFDRYSDSIRRGKNSRIDSLLSMLELDERHFISKNNGIKVIDNDINYLLVDKKVGELRRETWEFLRKALVSNEEL